MYFSLFHCILDYIKDLRMEHRKRSPYEGVNHVATAGKRAKIRKAGSGFRK